MDAETSSDEDEHFKLLQAMDKQFTNDNWYSKTGTHKSDNLKPEFQTLPPSLRNIDSEKNDQSTAIGVNVTPEFQKFVAKHLSGLLDKQLKEVELKTPIYKKKLNKNKKGVRLLHTSSSFLDVKDIEDVSVVHNENSKFISQPEVDSEEESERVRESAVSADWITSGVATKGWVKSTKGEVIKGIYRDSQVYSKSKKKKRKTITDQNISSTDHE